MKSFADFILEINLMEFAYHHGYRMNMAKGRKWPVLVHKAIDDRIIIGGAKQASHQYYWNPVDDKDRGTIIQFVRNRLGILFSNNYLKKQAENINEVLYSYLKIPPPEKAIFEPYQNVKNIVFNPSSLQVLTETNYLVNKRGIELDILNDEVFAARVMQFVQNRYINIAFPYTDGNEKIVGAELCNYGYKAQAAGSDRSTGIWHSNIFLGTKNIVICESGIDALSYHQLKGSAENLYISVGGNLARGQLDTIAALAAKNGIEKITGAFDNDAAGRKYNRKCSERFENFVTETPLAKDFNDDLINISMVHPVVALL
jgi:hypothetical protein